MNNNKKVAGPPPTLKEFWIHPGYLSVYPYIAENGVSVYILGQAAQTLPCIDV